METCSQPKKLHSEDYFNDQRDFWWNQDFLELMAQRWQFSSVKSALDVGCGVGHWGQLLASVLPSDCRVTGVDLELEWIIQAKERASKRGLGERFSYNQGQAEALPFPDEMFDLVTCQTVLMHLKDPGLAILEFMRVLKPGGMIIAAEPNNMVGNLVQDSISARLPIEELLQRIQFYLTCERGRLALGEGHNSIGYLVPGMFAEAGLKSIEVYQSDKASALIPPYETTEQKVNAAQMLDYFEKEILPWNAAETRRYFVAGGGSDESFDSLWQMQLSAHAGISEAIKSRIYHTGGGGIFYLICGRKFCG